VLFLVVGKGFNARQLGLISNGGFSEDVGISNLNQFLWTEIPLLDSYWKIPSCVPLAEIPFLVFHSHVSRWENPFVVSFKGYQFSFDVARINGGLLKRRKEGKGRF